MRTQTYINKTEPNGKPVFWGRGNGWAIASFVQASRGSGQCCCSGRLWHKGHVCRLSESCFLSTLLSLDPT
jgi:hypothetical protein